MGHQQPGDERVHQNAVGGELRCERLGHRQAGCSGCRGGARLRARGLRADVQRVDDPPPALAAHVRNAEPAEAYRREELQIEVVLPVVVVDIEKRLGIRRPGVVHENVDRAAGLGRLGVGPRNLVGQADIGRNGCMGSIGVGSPERVERLVEHGLVPGHHRHCGTRGSERLGHRPSQTPAAAGDQCSTAVKSQFHTRTICEGVDVKALLDVRPLPVGSACVGASYAVPPGRWPRVTCASPTGGASRPRESLCPIRTCGRPRRNSERRRRR